MGVQEVAICGARDRAGVMLVLSTVYNVVSGILMMENNRQLVYFLVSSHVLVTL